MASNLEGLEKLSKQLSELGPAAGGKLLRSATLRSTLPVVKAARANAPVGVKPHKTYKGRLVGAGFLSRSIARKSRLYTDKKTAYTIIGVKPEAFYGVQFLELGTKTISRKPWLTKALEDNQQKVVDRMRDILKKGIEKAAK